MQLNIAQKDLIKRTLEGIREGETRQTIIECLASALGCSEALIEKEAYHNSKPLISCRNG